MRIECWVRVYIVKIELNIVATDSMGILGGAVLSNVSNVSEHKVIIVTSLFATAGEIILLSRGKYFLAITLGLAIFLSTLAVYMPPKPTWRRAIPVSGAALVVALTTLFSPKDVLTSVLFSAVMGSFIAVRIRPVVGLIVFFSELAVACIPIFHATTRDGLLMTLVMCGAGAVLALQTYEVALKFHQYRRLSIFDDLTELHNHRYFRYKLNRFYRDAKVSQISLLLFDIDRFKNVNDMLGHRTGDEVLRRASGLLQATAAPFTVSRYGGEEFAILLPNEGAEVAAELAERLRAKMESTVLCGVPVTLSCGIATIDKMDMGPDELFDAADQALYQAKKSRNSVRVFTRDLGNEHVAAALEVNSQILSVDSTSTSLKV